MYPGLAASNTMAMDDLDEGFGEAGGIQPEGTGCCCCRFLFLFFFLFLF